MSYHDATHHIHLTHLVWSRCQRCGEDRPCCAKVAIHGSRHGFDTPKLTCASCRKGKLWKLAPDWKNPPLDKLGENDDAAFEAWKLANPPLDVDWAKLEKEWEERHR